MLPIFFCIHLNEIAERNIKKSRFLENFVTLKTLLPLIKKIVKEKLIRK